MTQFNGAKLAGDVMSVTKTGFVLSTTNESANGESYTEHIPVSMPKKNQPDWLKDGCKAAVKGRLGSKGDIQHVQALEITELGDDAEYLNIARLIGKVRYPLQYWSASEGKQAFGNIALSTAKSIFRGVLFGALATTFSRRVKKGCEVQIQGFLRMSEFMTRAGVKRTALEIVADSDWCEILTSAEENDEFADFNEDQSSTQAPAGAAF